MQCPKCKSQMEEQTLSTLEGNVTVDRCVACKGLWFDIGEAETLKEKWMSDHVDNGDPGVGRAVNRGVSDAARRAGLIRARPVRPHGRSRNGAAVGRR